MAKMFSLSPRSSQRAEVQEMLRQELADFAKNGLVETMHDLLQPWAAQIVQDVCNDVRQSVQGAHQGASPWSESLDLATVELKRGSDAWEWPPPEPADRQIASSIGQISSVIPFSRRFVKINRANVDGSSFWNSHSHSQMNSNKDPPGGGVGMAIVSEKSGARSPILGASKSDKKTREASQTQWEPGSMPESPQLTPGNSAQASARSSCMSAAGTGLDQVVQPPHGHPMLSEAEEEAAMSETADFIRGVHFTTDGRHVFTDESDGDAASPIVCGRDGTNISRFGVKLFGCSGRPKIMPDFDPETEEDPRLQQPLLSEEEKRIHLAQTIKQATSTGKTTRHENLTDNVFLNFVLSPFFERIVAVVLLCNALVLGVETEIAAGQKWGGQTDERANRIMDIAETTFCLVFTTEISCRILAHRCNFFFDGWNVFDLLLVSVQVVERVSRYFPRSASGLPVGASGSTFVRVLRMLRYVRITRVIRMIRLVEELRTIFSSITSSMLSLAWTLLLLLMLLYMVSVFFTQVVLEAAEDGRNVQELKYWYGHLGRTYLTMFECIFGGVSWDAAIWPLIEDVSPALAPIFMSYIAFCLLVMMNMATGVFVDNAIKRAQDDKDTNTANHISDLFFENGEFRDSITFEQFCSKIDAPDMQEYFRAINVDPSEARGLYRLLDVDGSGSVDAEEMVSGCLRLRGNAKALELQLLTYETNQMYDKMKSFQARCERCLAYMCGIIETQMSIQLEDPKNHVRQTLRQLPRKSQMKGLSAIGFSGKRTDDLADKDDVRPRSSWNGRNGEETPPEEELLGGSQGTQGKNIGMPEGGRRAVIGDDSLMGYNANFKRGESAQDESPGKEKFMKAISLSKEVASRTLARAASSVSHHTAPQSRQGTGLERKGTGRISVGSKGTPFLKRGKSLMSVVGDDQGKFRDAQPSALSAFD